MELLSSLGEALQTIWQKIVTAFYVILVICILPLFKDGQ